MSEHIRADFSGQRIYVGIDVHVKNWAVCILTASSEHKAFVQDPRAADLARYLRRNFPGAEYLCVYEAGYCGFWPQRAMAAEGLNCIVVHPADVPTTNKQRRRRRDRRDARKLACTLRSGDLTALYVPDKVAEQDRALLRTRHQLVKKQTACKNQITGQLRFYGFEVPEELERSRWSGQFLAYLEQLPFSEHSGRRAMALLLIELRQLRALLAEVLRDVRVLAQEDRYRENIALLRSVPGISLLSGMIFLTEVMDLRRFPTLDHLCSYVGLVPDEDSSGESVRVTGITRRRNPFLRHILIECTWTAMRQDPALLHKFEELWSPSDKKSKVVVAIARKLLNRMRHVLQEREPYQLGLIK